MYFLSGLLLFFGHGFLSLTNSSDEWLVDANRICDTNEILNSIINAERNKTIIAYFEEGCEADKLLNSPFCWGHRKSDVRIIVACGEKDLRLPLFIQKKSQSKDIITPIVRRSIFAAASDEATKKSHHTIQSKKKAPKSNSGVKTANGKAERKQKVEKKSADESETKISDKDNMEMKIMSREDKLRCKYRLNCYGDESGTGRHKSSIEEKNGRDKVNQSPVTVVKPTEEQLKAIDKGDKSQLQLACKYRYSCYAEHGIDSSANADHKKASIAQITTSKQSSIKLTSQQDVISTKEVASDVLRKVEKRERSHSAIPKVSKAEKLISDKKELEKRKNVCKYRKSCYETGKLPTVEPSLFMETVNRYTSFLFESKNSMVNPDKKEDFSDMTSAQQKLFCKYRKSCYESGLLPDVLHQHEFTYKDVLENNRKEVPITLRCKYRKSCYETGIIPSINEVKKSKEPTKVILPSNPHELKLFCKYRKSCYKQMSETAGTEADSYSEEDDDNVQNDDIQEEEINIEEEKEDAAEENEEQAGEDLSVNAANIIEEVPEKELIDDEASYEVTAENTEEKSEDLQDVPDVVMIPQKRRRMNQKVKQVKVAVGKDKEANRKETTESFCGKITENNAFRTATESEIPHSIRIKGKLPKKFTDYDETEDNIVVISKKRHLRKLKKDVSVSDEDGQDEDTINSAVEQPEKAINEVDNGSVEEDNDISENIEIVDKDDFSVVGYRPDNDETDDNEDSEKQTTTKVPVIINVPIDRRNKLECKYRKSCYSEPGDDINAQVRVDSKQHTYWSKEEAVPVSNEWSRVRKIEQLKCKYRKSCYQLKSLDEDQSHAAIKFTKPISESGRPPRHNPTSNHHPDNDERADAIISREVKLRCKFRHSCYEKLGLSEVRVQENRSALRPNDMNTAAAAQENAAINKDKNQIVYVLPNGTICSKYRISCREEMGLPRKERAPTGLNGQKLCRKKKTTKI